jgi:hypothetical protein
MQQAIASVRSSFARCFGGCEQLGVRADVQAALTAAAYLTAFATLPGRSPARQTSPWPNISLKAIEPETYEPFG